VPKLWFHWALLGVLMIYILINYVNLNVDNSVKQENISNMDRASFMPGLGTAEEIEDKPDFKKESMEVMVETPKEAEKLNPVEKYIQRFKQVAINEEKKFGIPASITLAQGILESQTGTSRLVKEANNHFGIKCFSNKCKKGHCINFSDDSHKDFFVVFPTAWESYRAHSLLISKDRYKQLKNLSNEDYVSWAKGLLKSGYATDKKYAEKLISVIERYELEKIRL
jgi:flagellum-specific peptidoglycan hydrolase FlgJ